jgi:IS605 OrfB family transposase
MSENMGNGKFQLTLSDVQPRKGLPYFDLKIILPNILIDKYGKTYTIKHITFPRGNKTIEKNILNHLDFKVAISKYKVKVAKINKITNEEKRESALKKLLLLKPKAEKYGCKAISFLIKKKKNGDLKIHYTIAREQVKITTKSNNGWIRVDINHQNISIAETNKVGKLVNSKVYKFNFGKTNSGAFREATINKHINDIVDYAKKINKPIVLEKLDFMKKKSQQLKKINKKYNRMLHTLAYAKITERFRIACAINGIEQSFTSPAYTSMLGFTLYSKKYGISIHQAAAYVIARVHMGLEAVIALVDQT